MILTILFTLILSMDSLSQNYLNDSCLLTVSNETSFHQTYKDDLNFILEQNAKDIFYDLINAYRSELNKNSIKPNKALYLSARNHLIYQLHDLKEADHYQTKNTPRFSGRTPVNRLKFVLEAKHIEIDFMTENCMSDGEIMSNINDCTPLSFKSLEELNEAAKMAAQTAFESWKTSLGHNANMVNISSKYYGIAFIIRDNLILSTAVFSNKEY